MGDLLARRIFWIIAALAATRLGVLSFSPPPVSYDEAQYWAWAQHLQLGYYSKPPMVAWVIWLCTHLLGDGAGAVKLGSTLAHTATACILYVLGRDLWDRRAGAWAALGWMVMPAVTLSSVMITTDPFLLTFWSLGLWALVRARQAGPDPHGWWVLLGVAFGLGLLSKYAMAFFLASLAVWLIWDKTARPMIKGTGPLVALGLGLLIYAPNALWNMSNGFVSYAHTRDNANLGAASLFNPDKLAEFMVGQFGVFGPIMAVGLILALITACRRQASWQQRLLASFALPVLAVMITEAFVSRANANWTAPALVAGILLSTDYLLTHRPRWLVWSLGLHLVILAGIYGLDHLPLPDQARFDPQKRIRGWDRVGQRVSEMMAQNPDARLLADERKVLAALIYYVRPHPFDAVKWNPLGKIRDHYDQTSVIKPGDGPFLYVTELDQPPGDMGGRFQTMTRLDRIVIPIHADYARTLTVWRLSGFTGY